MASAGEVLKFRLQGASDRPGFSIADGAEINLAQAVYCNSYLSEDKSQVRYGPLTLTPRTRIEIYPDRKIPIDQWILSVL